MPKQPESVRSVLHNGPLHACPRDLSDSNSGPGPQQTHELSGLVILLAALSLFLIFHKLENVLKYLHLPALHNM